MFSTPNTQRRVESAAVLAAALFTYSELGFSWLMFAVLFFIPDLAMFFYVVSKRVGGIAYNISHCFFWPIGLGLYAWQTGETTLQAIALIWLAHCAFDRALGWGLKYPTGFCDTDMGKQTLAFDNKYLR